jgi:hypothetical protein
MRGYLAPNQIEIKYLERPGTEKGKEESIQIVYTTEREPQQSYFSVEYLLNTPLSESAMGMISVFITSGLHTLAPSPMQTKPPYNVRIWGITNGWRYPYANKNDPYYNKTAEEFLTQFNKEVGFDSVLPRIVLKVPRR